MPEWTNQAPDLGDFAAVRLLRVPPKGPIEGVITSDQYLGCWTHWDTYRTQPCPGDGCHLCRDGQPRRWLGYISLLSQMTRRQAVIQITPLAAQQLDADRKRHGYLRGLLAQFSRVAPKQNARIVVVTRALPAPIDDLPPGVDIPRYMSLIWQTLGDLK